MDAGNLAFGGLLLGQLIGENPLDVTKATLGLSLWLALLAGGSWLMYYFPGGD